MPTATPTEMPPTPTPCSGLPILDFQPPGGTYPAFQPLRLDLSGSSDPCGRELVFVWDCAGPSLFGCQQLVPASQGGAMKTYNLMLYPDDAYSITVSACVAPASAGLCSTIYARGFSGGPAPPTPTPIAFQGTTPATAALPAPSLAAILPGPAITRRRIRIRSRRRLT